MRVKSIFVGLVVAIFTAGLAACGGGSTTGASSSKTDIGPVTNSLGAGPGKFAYVPNAGSNNIALLNKQSSGAPWVNSSLTAFSPYTTSQASPIALAIDAMYGYMYVAEANELVGIDVFKINDNTGALTLTAGGPYSAGNHPNDLALDPTGKFLFVANYNSMDVSVFEIDRPNGTLSQVNGSPYSVGSQATSVSINPANGCLYVVTINNGINVFSVNRSNGKLMHVSGSPFARGAGMSGKISFNSSGSFAYVAGGNSATKNNLGVFSIDAENGSMTQISGSPFHSESYSTRVTLDADNHFAYVPNQLSNNVSVYSINSVTGALSEITGSPFPTDGYPSSVAIDPTKRFAYVSNGSPTNTIQVFSIDTSNGALVLEPSFQISTQLYFPLKIIFY